MKKFLLRLLLDAILIYALAAVAFAFLHYPAARPAVGQIVTDFNGALTNVFRKGEPPASTGSTGGTDAPLAPDALGDRFAMDLSRISIPGSGSLSADAAKTWDALRPLRDDVLPKAHAALADLARLKTTDPAAFATQRDALRATLKQARDVLEPLTSTKMPVAQAGQLLEALAKLEAKLESL